MVARKQQLMAFPQTELVRSAHQIIHIALSPPSDINQGVLQIDPWLAPFKDALRRRFSKAKEWIKTIDDTEGGLDKFSKVCVFHSLEHCVPSDNLFSGH